MKTLRNKTFLKAFCYLFSLSFFLVSCDPKGYLMNDHLIDKRIEEEVAEFARINPGTDCDMVRKYLGYAKAYAMTHNEGRRATRAEIVDYLITMAETDGDMAPVSSSDRDRLTDLINTSRFLSTENNYEGLTRLLEENQTINSAERTVLDNLEDRLEVVATYSEASTLLATVETEINANSALTDNFKAAMGQAFNDANGILCVMEQDAQPAIEKNGKLKASTRCEGVKCIVTHTWVKVVITIVVSVIGVLLGIFTFGLSLIIAMFISISIWVLMAIVTCFEIPCPGEACPEGSTPTCHRLFTLNGDGTLCVFENVPNGLELDNNNHFTTQAINGVCPPEALFQVGNTCFIETLQPDFLDLIDQVGQDPHNPNNWIHPVVCR